LDKLLRRNPATGRPVDSIAELVPLLPRELRSNFTFVYDSRSPFRASISPEFPRAVLFTDDARLVLTFTGDPVKPGFDLLETLSFDDHTAAFTLRSYLLPAAERRAWRPTPEADLRLLPALAGLLRLCARRLSAGPAGRRRTGEISSIPARCG
jgi:hypothetical protein